MIYLPLSKFADSSESVVAPGAVITAEGQALVRNATAPATGVTPSTGTGTSEIFVGFAIAGMSAAPFAGTYGSKVEEFVVPVSGTVQLAQTPVAGQLAIYNITTAAAVAVAGGVTVVGTAVNGLTAGNTVRITYLYALTVVQARALQGDVQPGGSVGTYIGQVGVVRRGRVYLDQFDASKNWNAATSIKLAASGQVTDQSGAGTTIVGAYVVAVPSVDAPFLGIAFSAV